MEATGSVEQLAEQFVREQAEVIAVGLGLHAESICLMALNDDACYYELYNKCEESRILNGDKTKAAPLGVIYAKGVTHV